MMFGDGGVVSWLARVWKLPVYWAHMVTLAGWLGLFPSPPVTSTPGAAPAVVNTPATVTIDATQPVGTLPRTLYGLSLPRTPDPLELQSLAAQGVALITAPLSVPASEEESLAQQQKLFALLQAAEEWGITIVWCAPNDEVFVHRLLERAALSDNLRYIDVDAGVALCMLRGPQPPVPSLLRTPATVLLREPPMELISQQTVPAAAGWRWGISCSVADPNDQRLSEMTAALQRVQGDTSPLLFAVYAPPPEGVSASVGVAQRLQQSADGGVALSAYEMPVAPDSVMSTLRTFRLLEDWTRLYGSRVKASSASPLVAVATRTEESVSLCVANPSLQTVPVQLRLRLPSGAYRVEVRKTDERGRPGMTVEKPPLWVASAAAQSLLTVDLAPQALAALRLTNLPVKVYRDLGDLDRQIAGLGTIKAREKSRALYALRRARRPLAEVLTSQKFTPHAVSRAAHRALLQLGQAEAVFRNEVEKGRVKEDAASALNGQFAGMTHLLSAASAAGLGLQVDVNWQDRVDICPSMLPGQEPTQLTVQVAHQGTRPIEHVEMSVRTEASLTAEPLSRTSWAQLRPGDAIGCRFQVQCSPAAPTSASPAHAATPLLVQVTVSYYADRSNARVSRTVEFYLE